MLLATEGKRVLVVRFPVPKIRAWHPLLNRSKVARANEPQEI